MRTILLSISLMLTVAMSALAGPVEKVKLIPTPKMHCEKCEGKVRTALEAEKGIQELAISVADNSIEIAFDSSATNVETLKNAIEKAGYQVEVATGQTCNKTKEGACATKKCDKNKATTCSKESCSKDKATACSKEKCGKKGDSCCKK